MVICVPGRTKTRKKRCVGHVFDPFQGSALGRSQCTQSLSNQQSGDFNKPLPAHPLCRTFALLPLEPRARVACSFSERCGKEEPGG